MIQNAQMHRRALIQIFLLTGIRPIRIEYTLKFFGLLSFDPIHLQVGIAISKLPRLQK